MGLGAAPSLARDVDTPPQRTESELLNWLRAGNCVFLAGRQRVRALPGGVRHPLLDLTLQSAAKY